MKFSNKTILTVIILVSVSLRFAAALWLGDEVVNLPGTFDQISYNSLAMRVLEGHGFSFGELWWPLTAANAPTAHWSFLYTLYLVATYAIFGPHPLAARLIQAALVGILHPLMVYLIGRRMFGEIIGLTAAGLTAVYAYFIYYSGALMTEPFYITAILIIVWLTILLIERIQTGSGGSRPWVLAGALGLTLGCTVLMRQVFMAFAPFLFLWILLVLGKKNLRAAILSVVIAGGIIVAMIAPFTLYNYSRFGRPVLLNTNAGYAFFYANHPIYGTHFVSILPESMGTYQDLIPSELRGLDEAALDQALMARGMQFVFDDPVRYVLLSISRIPAFFMFWPSADSGMVSNLSRVGSFGILWPFMLYGALLVVFSKKYAFRVSSPSFLILAFFIIYSGIHLASWSLIRYRLPVDALMLIFAGVGLVDLAHRARAWLSKRDPAMKSVHRPGSHSQS